MVGKVRKVRNNKGLGSREVREGKVGRIRGGKKGEIRGRKVGEIRVSG